MPQRRAVPAIVRPHGLSDAADGTNSFPGAMRALMNLIPDPTTSDVWVSRPPATLLTDFASFTTPGFVSAELVIGNTVYGMIASGRNSGKDEPFVYNLLTNTFTTVSGITNANSPTSPATTGDWTPPIMARVAGRIIVTHPGFPGDQTKFGWFDISGFDEVVIGDVVTGSPVMTGNPSIFGIQPGMALSGVGGGGTVLQVANAYTGIAFTGDSHTTNTIDNITSTTGMFVGMIVTGPGIQGPTTIAQIIGGTSILLSRPATSSTTAGAFFVAAPGPTSADGTYSGTLTVGSPTITLASTAGLWVGQLISGNGIPLGSTIVSLVANTSITISQNVTAGGVQPFNVTGAVIVIDTAMGSTFDGMPAIVTGGTVAAPQWGAGDTQVNNLPSTPVGVAQMNGRAWFACGTDGIVFSDSGIPCQISNSPRVQALTTGDGLAVTAIGPQTLASLLGGQVQALIAFEGTNRMQQITGDPETNNLAMNALPVQTGTQAPLTLSNCEFGLSFVSPEGLRFITPAGTVSDPVGDAGMGITVPFIYSVVPSRMCAATNSHTIRITTQNGNKSGNPQEEYWFDLGRKVWCGPHTSTASLIQGWGADNFVMTFVGVNAALYVSSGVPTTSVDWLERGNPLMWWYMPVLQPDNLEVEMNAVVDMLLMCGGPDCDPLAAPEALTYSPTSNGSPPILPPFVTGRAAAMTLANATLSATGSSGFGALAVILDGAQSIWNFPAMVDGPSGILSFWVYVPNSPGAGQANPPAISDFYAFSGNFADPLVAPSDGALFTEPSFGARVTFNKITAITSAVQAVITFDGDLSMAPAVGSTIAVWITNNVAPWYSATARDLTVVSNTNNTITLDWDTSGFAAYVPATYPNTFIDIAYVTAFTRAAQGVISTAIDHGIDGSSGTVWVKLNGLNQANWSAHNNQIVKVASTTSNGITLDLDTSAIATAFDPTLNDVKIYVANAVDAFFANSDQSIYFNPRSTTPLPIGAWTNVLMSWDTNHAAGSKKFSMYFGDTAVAPYYIADFLAAFNIAYSTASTDVNTGWKAFGNGSVKDTSGYGYVAEYYFNAAAAYMDFSVAGNRAKFHDASNKPVDLGSTGSGPTGSAPTIYMSLRSGAVTPPPALVWWEPNGLALTQSPGVLGGIADSSQMVLSFWLDRNTSGSNFISGPGCNVSWDNEATPTIITVQLLDAATNQFIFSFPYSGGTGVNVRVAVNTAHAIGAKVVNAFVGTSSAAVTVLQDDVNNLSVHWQDGATDFFVTNGATGWQSEIWFGPGQFFDISGTEFVDGSGNPVNLGTTGQNPSGVSPAVFVHLNSGDAVSMLNTNRGTGGDFTGGASMLLQTGTRFTDNRAGSGNLRLATGPLLIAPTAP